MGQFLKTASITSIAILFLIPAFHSAAQTAAPAGIFSKSVYKDVKITKDITYGSNYNFFFDQVDTLRLDTYEPDSIVDYLRPVVIFIHGGGFVAGDKGEAKAVTFGNYFAQHGYLFASINYRLCINPPNDTIDNFQGVYQCVQDAMSAVRYFRKNAEEYCIDTSKIFLLGTSAGAGISLSVAYWDEDEANDIFDTTPFGPLDGSSGNEGYSSAPTAIISCWGGITDTSWVHQETVPNLLFHGTADPVVPYEWGLAANGVYLFGSLAIQEACSINGIESYLRPFVGAQHGVSINSPQFDTILMVSTGFLFSQLESGAGSISCSVLSCTPPTSQEAHITADGTTSFCKSKDSGVNLFVAEAGLTYQWTINGFPISGATLQTYFAEESGNFRCEVSNECGTTISNSIVVSENPKPVVTVAAAPCSDGTVLLTCTSDPGTGVTYKWKKNGVKISQATNSTYTATQSGSYTCTVKITESGCKRASKAVSANVNCKLDFPAPDPLPEVFPNPFSHHTTITFSLKEDQQIIVRVLDLQGRVIATPADRVFSAGTHQVTWHGADVAGTRAGEGVYLLQLTGKEGVKMVRVVLTK